MGRISRGWALTKQSWHVLRCDLSLVFFPILSAVFATIAAVAIWAPALIVRGVFAGRDVNENDPVFYIAGVATAYVSTFITIFFNVALAACAVRSMDGEDTKIREGVSAALGRIGPILGWSLVATTVGLVLRALDGLKERLPLVAGIIAGIVVWLAGAAWAIATFFVIPVVALEGHGPVQSLKRSAAIVKARWGEGATGAATIGLVTFLVSMLIGVVGAFGWVALDAVGAHLLGVVVVAGAIAGIIWVSILSSTLSQIFRVAVYQYAVSGATPGGFDSRLLQAAFVQR